MAISARGHEPVRDPDLFADELPVPRPPVVLVVLFRPFLPKTPEELGSRPPHFVRDGSEVNF